MTLHWSGLKQAKARGVRRDILFLSAVTGEGVQAVLDRVESLLESIPKALEPEAERPRAAPRNRERLPNKVWVEDGVYVVQSEVLSRLAARADTRDSRVIVQLWRGVGTPRPRQGVGGCWH